MRAGPVSALTTWDGRAASHVAVARQLARAELRDNPRFATARRLLDVARMATKLFCAFVLALGVSACVTDSDDAPPPPDDQTQLDASQPDGDQPDDDQPDGDQPDDDVPDVDLPPVPPCDGYALQSDDTCVPKPR